MGIALIVIGLSIVYFWIAVAIKRSIFKDVRRQAPVLFGNRMIRIVILIGSLICPISVPLLLIVGGILILFENVW